MDSRQAAALAAYLLDERGPKDDPWHQLSTGALTREEVVALRSRFEPPEAIARKLELFGPTSKERSEEVLKILLQRYFPGSGSEVPSAGASGSVESGAKPSNSTDDGRAASTSVVDLRVADRPRAGGRRWWAATVSGGFGLAAAVLLAWVMRPPERLPGFGVELTQASTGDLRSSSQATSEPIAGCDERYHREQSLVALLRPDSRPEAEALKVAIRAQRVEGEAADPEERWPKAASSEQDDRDVIRVELPLADQGLTPGRWALTFYVLPEEQRYDRDALRELEPGPHPGVSVARTTICIEE